MFDATSNQIENSRCCSLSCYIHPRSNFNLKLFLACERKGIIKMQTFISVLLVRDISLQLTILILQLLCAFISFYLISNLVCFSDFAGTGDGEKMAKVHYILGTQLIELLQSLLFKEEMEEGEKLEGKSYNYSVINFYDPILVMLILRKLI